MLKATRKPPPTTDIQYKSKLKVKANNNNAIVEHLPILADSSVQTAEDENVLLNTNSQKLSLKGSQLGGSILIGNYNYLTQLEVCENEMEILDLSSLAQLEILKCSRNKLMELIINGTNLQKLYADHNSLHSISTTNAHPVPMKLIHIDISNNLFSDLPNWIGACASLCSLDASYNRIINITGLLRNYCIKNLQTLNLSHNEIQKIESLPDALSSLKHLSIQSNDLQNLPENFFAVTHTQLQTLNASCNKLNGLPRYEQNNNAALINLYLAGNQLNDSIFESLLNAGKLKCLHLQYNRIGTLPPECLRNWSDLEILVLSGNMLQQLPEQVATLTQLRVLRCCNNLLLSTPQLAKLGKLKVLDLSHNHLDRVNLLSLVPSRNLKFLDLSGNLQLQVDEQQFKVCQTQSQRHWSFIDVSGNNRAALPTGTMRPASQRNQGKTTPWTMGFAESPGSGECRKLLVSQLRAGNYGGLDEALYGMFEANEGGGRAAQGMTKLVPDLLKGEQMIKDSSHGDYLKFTLLTAQQQCGSGNIRSAALFHLTRTRAPSKVRPLKSKRYVLRMASSGRSEAYLIRRTTQLRLTNAPESSNKEGKLPDPEVLELTLSNDDEYLVLGNSQLWSVMDIGRAARELRKEENALLGAKRLLDIAQSFGATENLSVIVVRFRHLGTDVDHLIRELKQSVRKKPSLVVQSPPSISVCKRTCCDRSNACRHRTLEHESLALAGRSSPSGQSDRDLLAKDGSSDEFILAHARVMQEEQQLEMLDETESVLSEEQFKCWEYMLEQNTQLLFDKELNTISKSFTKKPHLAPSMGSNLNQIQGQTERNDFTSNLVKSVANKFISSSTPQLPQQQPTMASTPTPMGSYHQGIKHPLTMSGHFGSALSFQQSQAYGYNQFDGKSRKSPGNNIYTKRNALGGPHSAYFGSLQRLMPYNFEYDFAVTQERERNILDEEELDDDDFNEHESRMRKYWGVATTEL